MTPLAILAEIDQLQKKINQNRPLDNDTVQQIKGYFRIGMTYTSNALEGNSLTESETKAVIEDGITIGGKPLKDHFEAIGHNEAYDHIFNLIKVKSINEEDLKKLHYIFYKRIDDLQAGRYRQNKVYISGSHFPLPLPEAVPELMHRLIPTLNALRIKHHPVEFAALAHKELVFIHPFIDGNGRVSRLLMNLILLQAGYTVAVIRPEHRSEYIQFLETAHDNDSAFVELIARSVLATQKEYLRIFQIL